jgi:hypothetical protein
MPKIKTLLEEKQDDGGVKIVVRGGGWLIVAMLKSEETGFYVSGREKGEGGDTCT